MKPADKAPSHGPTPLDARPLGASRAGRFAVPAETGAARYIRVLRWATRRYSKGGRLPLSIGGKPSRFTIIERLAACKHLGIRT